MALSTVTNGASVSHTDLDQLINVLQQPSGGSEVGKYILSGNCYIINGFICVYIATLSRVSVPISCSIDSVDVARAAWMNAPGTSHLTMGGVQLFSQFTSANASGSVGGNITFTF